MGCKSVLVLVLVLVFVVSCGAENTGWLGSENGETQDPNVCNSLPINPIYGGIESLMGLWHTVEIIQHRDEQRLRGVQVTDTCPMVHLSQTSGSDLKMLWHEPAGYVEYRFRITDLSNPGFWLSWGPQNGSMLSKPYQQFAGTVQVMKAVQTHMVLTFCSPNQSHYTIILARNNHLSMADIRGVRNLLGRRGLPQIGVRETCKDSAALAGPTVVLVLLAAGAVTLAMNIY